MLLGGVEREHFLLPCNFIKIPGEVNIISKNYDNNFAKGNKK